MRGEVFKFWAVGMWWSSGSGDAGAGACLRRGLFARVVCPREECRGFVLRVVITRRGSFALFEQLGSTAGSPVPLVAKYGKKCIQNDLRY